MKWFFLLLFLMGCVGAIAIYWGLKPIEAELVSTANASFTVNTTNYPGFRETINYWPIGGWFLLLGVIGYGVYKLVTLGK